MAGPGAPPTPKRRASRSSATPPPKASRMSAAAPVFQPAAAGSSSKSPAAARGDEEDEAGEDMTAITAAAVAQSRVTRPLPNSRRQAPGADFVPKAATVPKSADQKENTRRLIVVLSQVRLFLDEGECQGQGQVSWKLIHSAGMSRSLQSVVWQRRQELDGQRSQVCAAQLRRSSGYPRQDGT